MIETRIPFNEFEVTRQSPTVLHRINYGDCDEYEFSDVQEEFGFDLQDENLAHNDFRFPCGESYDDMILRLDPFVMEILRNNNPIVLIGHNSVLRCIYAYLSKSDITNVPSIKIPINTVLSLTPQGPRYKESRITFDLDKET